VAAFLQLDADDGMRTERLGFLLKPAEGTQPCRVPSV
jgi:hypothetical protein